MGHTSIACVAFFYQQLRTLLTNNNEPFTIHLFPFAFALTNLGCSADEDVSKICGPLRSLVIDHALSILRSRSLRWPAEDARL